MLQKVKRFAKQTKSYNGISTFWEHLSVGLVRGTAYGVDIMAYGDTQQEEDQVMGDQKTDFHVAP